MRARRILSANRIALAAFAVLSVACPVDPPDPPPLVPDPAEYVYDAVGSGTLRMAGGSTRAVASVIQASSTQDFHVPSSFDGSWLTLMVNFEDSDLALFLQLRRNGGAWESKGGCAHLAYSRYADGWANGVPYVAYETELSVVTVEDAGIIDSLTFSSTDWHRIESEPGWEGDVAEVSVSVDLSVLGYATVDYASPLGADGARSMDTRAALARMTPELDANVRADPEAYADDLALALVDGLDDPAAKLRAIFDWICANVYYDDWWKTTYYDVDPGGDYDEFVDKSPCAVLKSRKTVCGGFSLLFDWLCRAVGLRAPLVRGWVRSMDAPTTRMDHTWNAVSLNGVTWHVDPSASTSNSYTMPEGVPTFTPGAWNASWFLAPEETFRIRRNPYEAAYRYPGQPATGDEFYAQTGWSKVTLVASVLKDAFWERGYSLPDGGVPGVIVANGIAGFRIGLPGTPSATTGPVIYARSSNVETGSSGLWSEAFLERVDGIATLRADPTGSGYRIVDIWEYVGPEESYHLASVVARDARGIPASAPLPMHYFYYCSSGARLASPARDTVKAGTSASFSISAPGATRYRLDSVIDGTTTYEYVDADADGAMNVTRISPVSGKWRIHVTIDGASYFIVEYAIVP